MIKKRKAGGGRKPSREERKETRCVRLSPLLLEFIEDSGLNLGEWTEASLRRTKAFKQWLKQQAQQ